MKAGVKRRRLRLGKLRVNPRKAANVSIVNKAGSYFASLIASSVTSFVKPARKRRKG
ncbi:MAG: hypothetical protein QXI55_05860 [Thermofilum sp.]